MPCRPEELLTKRPFSILQSQRFAFELIRYARSRREGGRREGGGRVKEKEEKKIIVLVNYCC